MSDINRNDFNKKLLERYNAVANDKLNAAEGAQLIRVITELAEDMGLVLAKPIN